MVIFFVTPVTAVVAGLFRLLLGLDCRLDAVRGDLQLGLRKDLPIQANIHQVSGTERNQISIRLVEGCQFHTVKVVLPQGLCGQGSSLPLLYCGGLEIPKESRHYVITVSAMHL